MAEPAEVTALPAPIDTLPAVAVARRFHPEQRSKAEIAGEFGISRFKVARLLDAAAAHGIVRIDITVPAGIDVPPGRAMTGRWRPGLDGEIVEWEDDPEYRPSPRALDRPEPEDEVDRAVQLASTGHGPGEAVRRRRWGGRRPC